MAKVAVVVEFTLKEIQDALIEKAKQTGGIKGAGNASIHFKSKSDEHGDMIEGAVVTFDGKDRIKDPNNV